MRLIREAGIYHDYWNNLHLPMGPKEATVVLMGTGGQQESREGAATLLSPGASLWACPQQQQSLPGRPVQERWTRRPGPRTAGQSKWSPSHQMLAEPEQTLPRAEGGWQASHLLSDPDPWTKQFLDRARMIHCVTCIFLMVCVSECDGLSALPQRPSLQPGQTAQLWGL